MSDTRSLITINYKHAYAKDFVYSIANNNYYLFISNHIDSNSAARPFDNEEDTIITCYHGMILGKKIQPTDAVLMIPRIDWQSNTIYDIYDHREPSLYDKEFFVVANAGSSSWDIFKCLENGNRSPSIVAPSKSNISGSNQDFFYPVDGYRWKYMYSISPSDFNKFSTPDYVPVATDPIVSSMATPGSLDVIKVEIGGKGYNNYLNGTFTSIDIRLNGDQKKYGVSVSGVSTTNGYYDGCWLYISSGAGAGQYRMIESYISNSTYNYVILQDQFSDLDRPQNGSVFEITPSVTIVGDGREGSEATARAIIDSNGNTVSRIEMINRGSNYYHSTASVYASGSVGVTEIAQITPIISPVNGHGFDSERELGAKYACISSELNGDENGTVIVNNDYSQVGIIKNPLFNNIDLTLYNQSKDFFETEWVYKVNPLQLNGTITTNVDGNNTPTAVINVNSVDATAIAAPGMAIMINYANSYQIANVERVSNTYIILDRDALFYTGIGTANIHLANISSKGKISGFSAGAVNLTDVDGEFLSGDAIIGATTGVFAYANTVSITGVSKTFDTFVQVYTYTGTMDQGSFIADEVVFQIDNPSANARFHSISNNQLYFTNQDSIFNDANTSVSSNKIVGQTSGAIATLTDKKLPDLVFASGEIIYIEYDESISRSSSTSETYQFVFSF
jgi:hypothetical protein